MFKKLFVLFMPFVFCTILQNAHAEPYDANQFIDVGSPNVQKIRIGVTNFSIATKQNSKQHVVSATNRFQELLEYTNWFYLIPENTFPENAHVKFDAQDWKVLKADYVVYGQFDSVNAFDKYNLTIGVIDVAKNKILTKKTYNDINISNAEKLGKSEVSKSLNLVLRDFGDRAIDAITGKPGPFMTQVAFVGRKSKNSHISNIYIADFDGKNAYAITDSNTINLSPSWSPDGKKVLFTSFETKKAEIFEYNLSTKKTTRVTYANANSSGAVWNPTADLIAFASSTEDGETHLFTITKPGAPKEPLVTSSRIVVEPAFSPDGTRLAYTSNLYAKPMIFVLDFTTNKSMRITYAGWYNASAAWKPDSQQLAFASFDRQINRWDLFKINANGTDLKRLTLKQGDNEKPTWSPDGRFIMMQSNRGTGNNEDSIKGNKYHLYVMDADGDHQRLLETSVSDARQPAWGPRLNMFD